MLMLNMWAREGAGGATEKERGERGGGLQVVISVLGREKESNAAAAKRPARVE